MKYILPKKTSWLLLLSFFTFDAVVSYWAITLMSGREANLLIASYVETYPLLYFLCVPALFAIMWGFVFLLREALVQALGERRPEKKAVIEKIILTSIVIFWPVANSWMNMAFLLGFRQPAYMWGILTPIGLAIALGYGLLTLYKFS
jgi:hypothetical protein